MTLVKGRENPQLKIPTLSVYRSKFRFLTKQDIISELFTTIKGDAFFPLKAWPDEYKMIFWAKPIGDRDVFKLEQWIFAAPYHRVLSSQS